MSNPVTTQSGRTVKRTGMNESKKTALQKLKEAREGGIKRTDQYEVSQYSNNLYIDLTHIFVATGRRTSRSVRGTELGRV